jgi:DNA-binding NtrC family response regulator
MPTTEPDAAFADLYRQAFQAGGVSGLGLREWMNLAEAWRIAEALRETRGNRSAAARQLGIGRRTLYAKLDRLGLVPAWRIAGSPTE